MSRIGKQVVKVSTDVKIHVEGRSISVIGANGSRLKFSHHPLIIVTVSENGTDIIITRLTEERYARELHGLTRTLIANMIIGVTIGYEKRLKVDGIGYQAKKIKESITLTVGFANSITVTPPSGVTVDVPDPTTIVVKGADKQQVGQFAAELRSKRKPEPYKGKGIRYENETVRRKEGKAFSNG